MPRPRSPRRLGMLYGSRFFGPKGIPNQSIDIIDLTPDEVEAFRLADLEGLYHERAAEQLGISRTTFGRILSEARRKVADALVNMKALRIGVDQLPLGTWLFECPACGHAWRGVFPEREEILCPHCGVQAMAWTPSGHFPGRRRGRHRGGRL